MKEKLFTAQVNESSLESVIGGLKGWSHMGESSKRHTTYYPFVIDQRRIFFRSKNRTQAIRELQRVPCCSFQEVHEWCAESAATTVRRKRELARQLCMSETQVGNFGRFDFFKSIWNIGQ